MTGRRTVFVTVTRLKDNPFPELWSASFRAAGASVEHVTRKGLLRARTGGRALLNLQWPEWVLRGNRGQAVRGLTDLLATTALARLLGHRILLTVHNVEAHEAVHPRLERLLWKLLPPLCTDLHTFTSAGARQFHVRVPSSRRLTSRVIPHGDYSPVVGRVPDRDAARAQWGFGPSDHVFLMFGRLQRYKGLEALLAAFADVQDTSARLLVCGAPADDATREALRRAASDDPRISLRLEFLPQEDLSSAVRAADVVVLPYAQVTNSGSALFALTVGAPVVLPRTEVFEELAVRTGLSWVSLFDGPLSGPHLEDVAVPATGRPDLTWCSWEAVTRSLSGLLDELEPGGARSAGNRKIVEVAS